MNRDITWVKRETLWRDCETYSLAQFPASYDTVNLEYNYSIELQISNFNIFVTKAQLIQVNGEGDLAFYRIILQILSQAFNMPAYLHTYLRHLTPFCINKLFFSVI